MSRYLVPGVALILGALAGAAVTPLVTSASPPQPLPVAALQPTEAPAAPSLRSLEGLLVEMENRLDQMSDFQECWYAGGTPQDGWCLMPADIPSADPEVA